MKRIRFFQTVQWKIVILYLLLILIAMQVIGAYFIRSAESYYLNNFNETLNTQANLLAVNVEKYLEEEMVPREDIDNLIHNLFALRNADVQLLDQNGIVLTTTEENKAFIGQKNTRAEVNMALLGTRNESIQYNPETRQRVKVLALPIKKGTKILGVLYMVASMEEVYHTMRQINGIFATGTGIALLLTAALGIVLARTITTPVKEITRQATAMANGDFNRQVRIYSEDEIGQLGETFNLLTRRLKQALSQTEAEKEKLSSILANMSDGVIAADGDRNIILVNKPAQRILGVSYKTVLGKNLYEVLSIPGDSDERDSLFEENGSLLMDMNVEGEERLIRFSFTVLKNRAEQKHAGIIAVLQDVTEQKALERERQEFVANVSHELRTPLTTLKSYLEALEEGVVDDPELSRRFLRVLLNETDRMTRLVTDLLQLSRYDAGQYNFDFQPVNVPELLQDVVERFALQSRQENIELQLDFPAHDLPPVKADRDNIIQVLDNLISNAMKYSNENTKVMIQACEVGEKYVRIDIMDEGMGIRKRDLTRIFERFYRVDKARSRSMGGTGLGLSIARQIVLAHGGTIEIDSEWQKGTRVSFTLPVYEEMKNES
ncbi:MULTISPECIES: cell wall metabolism sensor histidine kinase WalK [Aneurinibacillus]|uniref:histidine kinase n=1 Tax=Aneurinibacillus thermoaerophilus TaxID=143495 RepID=A0A1G8DC99_ANETH|nr:MULTISPECIES: cell wall metabolism sensor histidine kinase WalK [Aneurinibacillus]AMA71479.1 PAS domain-containing sensor histidine kinase [Aneurinibacillus sp. XH2]MED0675344.1 cell wall metabolism sensor histidine kinase WalK [Aneurinibacillus thermoaerophilus]MED0679145.1 cell wall metabolism sensor histidine kinase WalK [Aneurinibacillus thermoaerophilus]MED0738275.1 cell wall metabolism sensor histidine kinase WalK [Aneurinibacillus thermoaerophilus]MED0757467.1 cell wall metabolism se